MDILLDEVGWEDRTTLALGTMYGRYGYSRYRMEKFEAYDTYMENKNFLKSTSVITFPDSTGRLMALKPDVTMSVVKNVKPEEHAKKVYYVENVFRMERDTHEYREVKQIGLEYIGDEGFYPEAETMMLAAKTLETISNDFVICISHMDVISGLLEEFRADESEKKIILDAIRKRTAHGLTEKTGLSEENAAVLKTITCLPGDASLAIDKLHGLNMGEKAAQSVSELERIVGVLSDAGFGDKVRIDFSIINDTDYYSGTAFQGYINGVPRAVLSGGRYDNLMHRLGKDKRAIGFAVYLGELTRYFNKVRHWDADVALVYGDTPAEKVFKAVESYAEKGLSVRAFKSLPAGFSAKETVVIE
jgi:ATP phosphoribosyltransferase regulatory subunit